MNSVDGVPVLLSASSGPASSDRELRAVLLDASPQLDLSQPLPAEVLLLRVGVNRTTHGDLYLDEAGAREALAYEAARGIDLRWDLDHESEPTSATYRPGAPARGWFSLRWDGSALYASAPRFGSFGGERPRGIFWEAETAAQIKARKLRYVSPSIRAVEDSAGRLRVVKVTSAALTNDPATLGARPLLLTALGVQMSWQQILAALERGNASPDEIAAARAAFEAAEKSRSVNLSADSLREENKQLKERLEREARERVLSDYKDRYQPEERSFLLGAFDAATLKSYLEARKPTKPADTTTESVSTVEEPRHLTNPDTPGPRVSGGVARGFLGRPWQELSYKHRAALAAADPATYKALRTRAAQEGHAVHLAAKEAAELPIPRGALIGHNAGRPIHLATGVTPSADLVEIIPEVLTDAVQAGFAGVRALYGSGVAMVRGTLPSWGVNGEAYRGGSKVKVPYFEPLGDFEEVTDEAAPPSTIQKLETTAEEAVIKHHRLAVTLTYEAQSFAAPGSDPYVEAARQMVERAELVMDAALIAAARTTTLAVDISASVPGTLDYPAFVDLLGAFGDEEMKGGGIALFSLHSHGLKQARLVRDDNGLPIFTTPRAGEAPQVLGIPVYPSDKNALAAGKHVALALKRGALALWFNAAKLKVQTFHDVSTDADLNALHLYFAAHLYKRLPNGTKPGSAKLTYNPLA